MPIAMLTEGYSAVLEYCWVGVAHLSLAAPALLPPTHRHCWAHTYTSTRKLMDSSKCCVGARESF